MSEPGKNLAASIHQRLLHVARTTGQDFQQLLTRFAIERLLVRLVESTHADEFILKGAMLFVIWVDEPHRATIDLDLLGRGTIDEERLHRVFTSLAEADRDDDALDFDASSIALRRIREGERYEGIQVRMTATLGKARIHVKVDVGFGDAVTPGPRAVSFPTLLDISPLTVRAYPRETVVAEKLHAVVTLGIANSRLKDFYDLWFLARRFDFDGATLLEAVSATFERRQTAPVTEPPIALTDAFANDAAKTSQWTAFLRKLRPRMEPPTLADVISELRAFATPLLYAMVTGEDKPTTWPAGGPWSGGSRGQT